MNTTYWRWKSWRVRVGLTIGVEVSVRHKQETSVLKKISHSKISTKHSIYMGKPCFTIYIQVCSEILTSNYHYLYVLIAIVDY